MLDLIKAEFIKGKRSFGRKILLIFPLAVVAMATVLMGGGFTQIGAFNWWYVLLMPTVIALLCINLMNPDKKLRFFNVLSLPIPKAASWQAKAIAGCLYLLVANLIVFGLTTVTGAVFGAQYPIYQGIAAALILTVTCAWQIPVGMALVYRLNPAFTLVLLVFLNLFFSSQPLAGGPLWPIPFSIPARLMAPVIGVNPNGVALAPGDVLLDTGVILPGLLLAVALLIVCLITTSAWFSKRDD